MGFYYLEGILFSWRQGGHFLWETGHTFTCAAGTDIWAGSVYSWPSKLCPDFQASLCQGSYIPRWASRRAGAWPGDAYPWKSDPVRNVMPSPVARKGSPSTSSSGQQDLPVSQAGPSWLHEALGGALLKNREVVA